MKKNPIEKQIRASIIVAGIMILASVILLGIMLYAIFYIPSELSLTAKILETVMSILVIGAFVSLIIYQTHKQNITYLQKCKQIDEEMRKVEVKLVLAEGRLEEIAKDDKPTVH